MQPIDYAGYISVSRHLKDESGGDIFSYGIGLMILDVYPGNAEALTTTLRIRTILGASL